VIFASLDEHLKRNKEFAAQQSAANTSAARTQYEQFLQLWKDADTDFSLLRKQRRNTLA
jgi:hypothetical protein